MTGNNVADPVANQWKALILRGARQSYSDLKELFSQTEVEKYPPELQRLQKARRDRILNEAEQHVQQLSKIVDEQLEEMRGAIRDDRKQRG